MGATSDEQVPVHRAATVILVRDGDRGLEALLVRRNSNLVFHGGSWVFPGGRMDPGDYPPEGPEDHEAAAVAAAVREAHEEAGLLIPPTSLRPFSHWTTPPGRPRRFATWFFLATAPDGDVATDGSEIDDHRWFTPAEALDARQAGEIELPPPTFVSLTRLGACRSAADALAQLDSYPYLRFNPKLTKVDGGMLTFYEGDAAYEDHSRAEQASPRHRLRATKVEWRYENVGLWP
ncbi:MAG: NUDIX domain-containing protein [Acidimicrobiia bacterium]|nr:NUDIX domain-containing protein [Acidimicrobiia bacterium]